MSKLTTSQKIIFSILALSVIFLIYDLFLSSPVKKPAVTEGGGVRKPEELKSLLSGLSIQMTKEKIPDKYIYLINRAEANWPRNPFYDGKRYRDFVLSRKSEQEIKGLTIKYSGYLDLGGKKMAIINDGEYGEGEPLHIEGYMLRHIYPDRVTIEHLKHKVRYDVPLSDN